VCKYKLQQNRYICRCGVQDFLQWVPVTAVYGSVEIVPGVDDKQPGFLHMPAMSISMSCRKTPTTWYL
jgi:hypothetical protein